MSKEFYSWEKIRFFLVKTIYADTNKSYHISSEINKLLKQYDDKTFVLNIGSGNKRLAPHVKNLDIIDDLNVDYVCSADKIPIESNSVDLNITQEAFEHIPNSTEAIKECYRILKNDGKIYFQVPFIVGYHPGPTDFYRFTKEGIEKFRRESISIRKKLRSVQLALRQDIDRLDANLKVINIGLMPTIVILLALCLGFYRRKNAIRLSNFSKSS